MNGKSKKLLIWALALQSALLVSVVVLLVMVLGGKTSDGQKNENQLEIYLPETYYVASGLTLEIYNSQITNLGGHIAEYDVLWECDMGENLKRKFRVEADDEMIGEYDLKVSVLSPMGELLGQKESTLSIVEAKQEPVSILALGDSLSANGSLYWKLLERLDGNLICTGTRPCESFLTEARHGFSAEDYLNETPFHLSDMKEECHPFYNPKKGRFDWNYYKETTGVNPEAVWVFLGANKLHEEEKNVSDILKIVELIRKDDKELPIYVINTVYAADQNGLGSWKNSDGQLMMPGVSKQERDQATFRLMVKLAEELEGDKRIYLIPAAISMDSATVYETEERQASPYSKQVELYAVDPLHPTKAGYYQIADVIYSTLCGTMDEWK